MSEGILKRKPTPYEQMRLYMEAKEYAFSHSNKIYAAAVDYLQGIKWLRSDSVDEIAANVYERWNYLNKNSFIN